MSVMENLAVHVQNGVKLYERGKNVTGLDGVNMAVPRGSIYGLLGPSGCGKTTLLRTLVGLSALKSGRVLVFNEAPGTDDSGVPGPWIGFMPQDMCLYSELTAEEHLEFFGSLLYMASSTLQARIKFLLELLDIPMRRLSKSMSGGQQRRLSLAIAMVHDPPMLVLDEPTVGVDPCLRHTIWKHLQEVSVSKGKTIILSTHQIEEAENKCNIVGFMRDGRILVEDDPKKLMTKSQALTLEQVFFNYCDVGNEKPQEDSDQKRQDVYELGKINPSYDISSETSHAEALTPMPSSSRTDTSVDEDSLKIHNYQPSLPDHKMSLVSFTRIVLIVFWKYLKLMWRNVGLLVTVFVSPLSTLLLSQFILNTPPYGLKLALVNDENAPVLSRTFIQNIDKVTFDVQPYGDLENAVAEVRTGFIHAALHIGPNFTRALLQRTRQGLSADNSTIEAGLLHLYTNNDNLLVIRSIYTTLLKTFGKIGEEMVHWLNAEVGVAKSVLMFENPVLGSNKIDYSTVLVSNMLADTVFVVSMALSTLVLVGEKHSGLLDRSRVSGLNVIQIVLAHALVICLVTLGQIILETLFLITIGAKVKGSYLLLIVLLYQSSFVGMAFGVFISAIVPNTFAAILTFVNVFWLGSCFTCLMWPLQSQSQGLRQFSQAHPGNWNYQAVNYVLNYGLGVTHYSVWRSMILSNCWNVLLLVSSVLIFRRRK